MEEAPVAVTAATGALGPVVAKLSTLLRRHGEYKLRRGTRKDIKLIRSKLKSIHSILWVIWEREQLDAAGKELRMEAWRLADDMNDAIDDFISSLKRSNDGRRFMQAKIQPSSFPDLKARAEFVSQRCRSKWKKTAEAADTTISSLFSRTRTTVESGPAKLTRLVDPYVHKDVSELVGGMIERRDGLIKDLKVAEEESTPELKMASIVGPAGVGKTTLARLVYEAIEDKFQARAFVSIISSHNKTEVLAIILQQIAAPSIPVPLADTKPATEKHLVKSISNFLKDKRYLVIVDDIWHYEEWKTIKKSLPNNNLGSRIVTTSRLIAIAEKWRDDFDALVYEINYLRNNRIAEMIAMNPDMVGEHFDHYHATVNMCAGMPLAGACMISALAKERECQEQHGLCCQTRVVQDRTKERVQRNGIQDTPGFEPLVESLELGYKDLPHHMLRTCLLYCSIYSDFEKDDLVIRWIAEGFVCKEATAEDYFDELVSRGLFQSDGDNSSYKLHPMMRNYLRWKLREENFIPCTSAGVPSSPVGRLCIDNNRPVKAGSPDLSKKDNRPISDLEIDWHHIRWLVVFNDADRVPYNHLQHLRVLETHEHDEALENQHLKDMCGLLRLRHLLMFGGQEITEMPTEIARLQYLETLKVTGTKISKLPAEIGDLKQLKTLSVCWNRGLTELPREMENLQHLETLRICETSIREQAWKIIGTLKKLKTLDLSRNYELSGIPRDIGELQQLKNLDVSRNSQITELPKEIGTLQRLKTLSLSHTGITELPGEICNLQHLQGLYLMGVKTITKLPRDIGRLQNLEKLDLSGTNVRKIPRGIGGLKKLKNPNAKFGTLPFEAGRLSNLERLPECVHKAWKNSDLVSSLAGEILSFQTTVGDSISDGGLVVGTKHMHIPHWIKEHFNNVGTLDIRICKVEEQDLKILREMPYLEHLSLRFEAVPKEPIVITSGGFAKLYDLVVDSRVPRIRFQRGAMPKLNWLTFEFQFYGGPPSTDHSMGITNLDNLRVIRFCCNGWYREDSPCISATIHAVRKENRGRTLLTLSVGGQERHL